MPLSLASRIARFCERHLNGVRVVKPAAASGSTVAAFVIRDGRGDAYRIEVSRHV